MATNNYRFYKLTRSGLVCHRPGQGEKECSAPVRRRSQPDASTVPRDNRLTYGQADSRARIPVSVEPFEQVKNAPAVLGIDSNAVVPHREDPLLLFLHGGDMDLGPTFADPLYGTAGHSTKTEVG